MNNDISTASFRDPSGFIFKYENALFRQVNKTYKSDYDELMLSGLYDSLTKSGLLVKHEESSIKPPIPELAYKTIKPELISFISYPYEWSFSQLKDAALVTLQIQKTALNFGMSLKDCSAYNIQFEKGRPVFIDTLSFERYKKNAPWVAYRQFCGHFLAPLALMAKRDIRLNQLLKIYIDGIPLDLTSSLLPWKTHLSFSLLSHIHLHSKSQKHFEDKAKNFKGVKIKKTSLMGLIDNLEGIVKSLHIKIRDYTGWSDYYDKTNYSENAFEHKKRLVKDYISYCNPTKIWDMGANTGVFSRLFKPKDALCVSFDLDPFAVDFNYRNAKKNNEVSILPLVMDLSNPSPALGWAHNERLSLQDRGPADATLALALIHHLAIGNNLPFSLIAQFFSKITRNLIIEFIPKEDSQIQKMLFTREDIFTEYSKESFELEFSAYFKTVKSCNIEDSKRSMFMMTNKTKL